MIYGDSGLAVTRDLYRESGGYPAWPLFEDVALSKAIGRLAPVGACRDRDPGGLGAPLGGGGRASLHRP